MSRRLSWGVAVGATLLLSVAGCSQQVGGTGQANGAPTDVCGLLAAPVTAALVQNGITATPVNTGTANACTWKDAASATTVVLTIDKTAAPAGGQAQSTTVPGVGEVKLVGPGEVAFTVAGRPCDLAVDSKKPAEINSQTAIALVATVGKAIGAGGGPAPAAGASTAAGPAKDGPAAAGSEQNDSTVTVTDINDRKTDLRTASVTVPGDALDLGNGQSVPLRNIARVDFTGDGSSDPRTTVTLVDGQKATGTVFGYTGLEGESDLGAFRQLVSKLKSVEFRRNVPFVATPDPQLPAWDTTTITVTETTGTQSEVKAPTLRFLADPGVTLDNGQSVLFRRVTRIDAAPTAAGGVQLTVTLANGKKVTGTIDSHVTIDGDTDGGPLSTETAKLKSIQVNRGGATGS